jgi:DNA-binding LacI/PurR family transcriptional regulator
MPATLERQSVKSTFTQSKYRTLAEQFREQIERGKLQPGDRLPSFVELRAQHGATPTTANQVYALLEQEGLIERQQGRGTFVAERKRTLTGNIGFVGSVFLNSQRSPFKMHLMKGVQEATEAAQQHLLYLGTDYSLNVSAFSKVDGVLICNIEDPRPVLQNLPVGLPRVALLNINEGVTSVVADDYAGSKMAIKHLASFGHQRIACLMEKTPSLARRRFAGYSDGLLEAGIEANPALARLTQAITLKENAEPYLEWGRREMNLWLQEGFWQLQCTALFVQNEMAAIGVMQILQQEGWKVPDDISVMGFDGTELCDYAIPRLSAMELPLAKVGAKATEILNRQIAGEKSEAQTITLPVRLRDGDSVAPPQT